VFNDDVDRDSEPPSEPSLSSVESDAGVIESAMAFADALREAGYLVDTFRVDDDAEAVVASLCAGGYTAVANFVESIGGDAGREAEFADLLEEAGLRYTGNGPVALRIAQAKDHVRALLIAAGVPVAPAFVADAADDAATVEAQGLTWPLFVKPARVDGSIGIDQLSICYNEDELRARIEHLASRLEGPWLVEEYLPGREINVAIFPSPDGELIPTQLDFSGYPAGLAPIVTYNAKWIEGSPEWACFSTPEMSGIAPAQLDEVLAVARAAFAACGGTSYGRVDVRLDRNDRPCVMDVNPNPDLHPTAGYCIAVKSRGIDYISLARTLIDAAALKGRHAHPTDPGRRPERAAGNIAAYR
jgi:D-alanine-D-alanine ligase